MSSRSHFNWLPPPAFLAELARLSELAYEQPEKVRRELHPRQVTFVEAGDTQAILVEDSERRIVAFRGTQFLEDASWADIRANLRFRKAAWSKGKVHRGYRQAYLTIHPGLSALVGKRPMKKPLVLTGHSLGGSLAVLASSVIDHDLCVTFGAPRVGNRNFAGSLSGLLRIVNHQDIAPKVPFLLGYRHGGRAWRLTADGRLKPDRFGWKSLLIPFTRKGILRGVLDHRIGEYRRKLTNLGRS